MDHAQVIEMAGAEVMTWNLNTIPFAASEVQGPIVVRLHEEIVPNGVHPFYVHPIVCQGIRLPKLSGWLFLWDPRKRRFVQEFERGKWDTVQHEPKYAGIYVGPRGGTMVR